MSVPPRGEVFYLYEPGSRPSIAAQDCPFRRTEQAALQPWTARFGRRCGPPAQWPGLQPLAPPARTGGMEEVFLTKRGGARAAARRRPACLVPPQGAWPPPPRHRACRRPDSAARRWRQPPQAGQAGGRREKSYRMAWTRRQTDAFTPRKDYFPPQDISFSILLRGQKEKTNYLTKYIH